MSAFGNHNRFAPTWCVALGLTCSALAMAEDIKPLSSFPEAIRLWMGLEEGSIRPAAYEQIRASTEGFVALRAKDGQLLAKDEPWATLDPEQLEIEKKTLELETVKLELKVKKSQEDAQEKQLHLSVEIHDAEKKRDDLMSASRDTAVPPMLQKRAAQAITKIDRQIRLLNERADPARIEREIQLEMDDGNLQIERKRKQFVALEKRSRLVAGFAGELRFSESLKKHIANATHPQDMVWVMPNEHLATLINDELFEISVTATSPLLAQIPQDELLVFIQEGKTGCLIAGQYSRTDEVDSGSEIVQNYIFSISENYIKMARHSVGQRNLVHVYRKFPRPLRIIQKKDLAFLAPDLLAASGWDGVVRQLWPGSEVIQVGPQAIAVKPKDEN